LRIIIKSFYGGLLISTNFRQFPSISGRNISLTYVLQVFLFWRPRDMGLEGEPLTGTLLALWAAFRKHE
jgi:hypothetical protein